MDKKKVSLLCAAILLTSAVAELLGVHMHSPSWWPLPFGYSIFFGFVGCWTLIFISKAVMARLLQRDEDYYDDGGEENE